MNDLKTLNKQLMSDLEAIKPDKETLKIQKEQERLKIEAENLLKKQEHIKHLKSISNIPARYKEAELKPINAEQELFIKKLSKNISSKKLSDVSDMLVYGSVGTGKTYLCCALANKLNENEIFTMFVTEHDLLESYFQKNYTKFNNFKKAKILIIDELAKRDLIEWQKIQIEELLSYRYNEMLPTIIITNRSENELKQFLGDRLTDRLRDNKVIRFTFKDKSLRGVR